MRSSKYSNSFFKMNQNFVISNRKQADSDTQPLLQQQQQQEQQQQMVPLQDSYMQSRAEALQNVEATIHELGSIFNQLATLVSQQGEIAIRCTFIYFAFIIFMGDVMYPRICKHCGESILFPTP